MRRKGVVFSKMFVLRSMGNELVPSPFFSHVRRARLETIVARELMLKRGF